MWTRRHVQGHSLLHYSQELKIRLKTKCPSIEQVNWYIFTQNYVYEKLCWYKNMHLNVNSSVSHNQKLKTQMFFKWWRVKQPGTAILWHYINQQIGQTNDTSNNLNKSQGNYAEEKLNSKRLSTIDSIYITFLKLQRWRTD